MTKDRVFQIGICVALQVAAANADTPGPKVELGLYAARLEVGPGMDASSMNLRGSRFVGTDLRRARFDNCDLDDVVLDDCNLAGASFRDTQLSGLMLNDCDITGATFSGASINGLKGMSQISFSAEQLTSSASYKRGNLNDCVVQFEGVPKLSFRDFDLHRIRFVDCDLSQCDFENADILYASFERCRLSVYQLKQTRHAKWRRFNKIQFIGVNFVDDVVDLSGCNLSRCHISWSAKNIDLTNADISASALFGHSVPASELQRTLNFAQGNLVGMTFRKMDLSGLDFSSQNLTGASFSGCNLTDADFSNAVVTCADFRRARGLKVEQIRSTWNVMTGRLDSVRLPDNIKEQLSEGVQRDERQTDSVR